MCDKKSSSADTCDWITCVKFCATHLDRIVDDTFHSDQNSSHNFNTQRFFGDKYDVNRAEEIHYLRRFSNYLEVRKKLQFEELKVKFKRVLCAIVLKQMTIEIS